jgi:hypothetical protein
VADFTADFEAGSNGSNITTGAGEASATQWNAVFFDAPTYSNSNPAHGSLKALVASSGNSQMVWNMTTADHYGRIYFYAPSNPPTAPSLTVSAYDGGASVASIYVVDNGKIRIADSALTLIDSTGTIATGQWVRLEWHIIHSATVGQIIVRYFADADSATVTEEISSPANWNTHAAPTTMRFGGLSGGSWQPSLDDIVANATTWPGSAAPETPVTAPQRLQPRRGGTGRW